MRSNQTDVHTRPLLHVFVGVMFLLAFDAFAAQTAPLCTAEGLSRKCELFKGKGNGIGIFFPDGTFIPNPFKIREMDSAQDGLGSREKSLRAQVKVMTAFQRVDSPKIAAGFLIAFNGVLKNSALDAITGSEVVSKHHEPEPLLLPWPPTSEGAPLKRVSVEQLKQFISALPSENRIEITNAIREARVPALDIPTSALTSRRNPPKFYEERAKRAQQLFEEAKKGFLDEIQRGRSYESLNQLERAQFRKVKTVQLKEFIKAESLPGCNGVSPDAFYSMDHTVTLCPNYLTWPDAALVEVLGHELAHAIDPCNSQFPLVKLNKSAVDSLPDSEDQLPDEIRNNPERLTLVGALKENQTEHLVLRAMMGTSGQESLSFLESKRYFEVVADGIPFAKSPTADVYRCLVKSAGIRELKAKDLKKISEDYLKTLEGVSSLGKNRAKRKKAAVSSLSRYPQCVRSPQAMTQVQEAMSDAWSAKVLGR